MLIGNLSSAAVKNYLATLRHYAPFRIGSVVYRPDHDTDIVIPDGKCLAVLNAVMVPKSLDELFGGINPFAVANGEVEWALTAEQYEKFTAEIFGAKMTKSHNRTHPYKPVRFLTAANDTYNWADVVELLDLAKTIYGPIVPVHYSDKPYEHLVEVGTRRVCLQETDTPWESLFNLLKDDLSCYEQFLDALADRYFLQPESIREEFVPLAVHLLRYIRMANKIMRVQFEYRPASGEMTLPYVKTDSATGNLSLPSCPFKTVKEWMDCHPPFNKLNAVVRQFTTDDTFAIFRNSLRRHWWFDQYFPADDNEIAGIPTAALREYLNIVIDAGAANGRSGTVIIGDQLYGKSQLAAIALCADTRIGGKTASDWLRDGFADLIAADHVMLPNKFMESLQKSQFAPIFFKKTEKNDAPPKEEKKTEKTAPNDAPPKEEKKMEKTEDAPPADEDEKTHELPSQKVVTRGQKRPPSAFAIFCNDNREKVKKSNSSLPARGITEKLIKMWRGLSDEEKAVYKNKASERNQASPAKSKQSSLIAQARQLLSANETVKLTKLLPDLTKSQLNTLLHRAVRLNETAGLQTILQTKRVDIDDANWFGDSPLHVAVAYNRDVSAKILLDAGADVNASNCEDVTPLHLACGHGNKTIVTLLLQYGADPNKEDDDGDSAFVWAKDSEITKLLKTKQRFNVLILRRLCEDELDELDSDSHVLLPREMDKEQLIKLVQK